jgi:hypothetical protein
LCELKIYIGVFNLLFTCYVIPVGSSYERTKINNPGEFDFDFVLTRFSSLFDVSTSPACPPGFIHLKRNEVKIHKEFQTKA